MNVNLFKTKKLLFLGATQFQIPAIKTAQGLGIQVIVTDNVPTNMGHLIGDFSENISTTDLDGLVEIAKKYNIDGVMTYGSDVSSLGVSYVAEKLKLPGNPYNSTKILQRKDEFRKFQKSECLPHPEFFVLKNGLNPDRKLIDLTYPLLVKPVDSSGSKGQSIVETEEDLINAINKARENSRCGIVICEKLLKSDNLEFDGDALIQNGRLSFGHYGHNYFLKNRNINVPVGEIMPGFFDYTVIEKIDHQLQKIISFFNLNTGCINFDALLVDEEVVILDIGLRNGGNYVPELIKMSSGVDLTEAAIYCALGLDYHIEMIHPSNPKPVMTYILNSKYEGQFTGIRYSPDIVKNIKKSINFVEFESNVKPFNRGDNALGVVFLEFDTIKELQDKWQTIEDLINIDIIPKKENAEKSDTQFGYKRYKERISPFLLKKIGKAYLDKDEDIVRVLTKQFVFNSKEEEITENEVIKHYDATADFIFENKPLYGVERLYRRQIVVDITLKCIAHCRHCLRRNYEPFILSDSDLRRISRFIGQVEFTKDVKEILITGGDPFLVPKKLHFFLQELSLNVPFLETVRIASRLPLHQPDWINDNILSILKSKFPFRIEIATQINHSIELFPEVKEAYYKIRENVTAIYNQTVLLNGVNNSLDELVNLFDNLRTVGIENHYLFHCVPIGGLDYLRTTINETIDLANRITSSGLISGRAKPNVSLMTDIGKITLYEGAIVTRKEDKILLRSNYSLNDRLKWNPSWKIPASAQVENDGLLSVWYQDKKS